MKKIVIKCCADCSSCEGSISPIVCVRNGIVWGLIKDKDTIPDFCPLQDDDTEKLREALKEAAITINAWQRAQWPSYGIDVMTVEEIVRDLLKEK